ncbi:MAG: 50S ribosomal protein L20 [Chloroflexota bacterium]
MPRARTGVVRRRRHKKIIKMVKGQWGTRGTLFKRSNEAMIRSLFYAYRDRRQRKRQMRRLWIQRINAGSRQHGLSYSRLIHGLKLANVDINRKMMALLAVEDPQAFEQVVVTAKEAIAA